MVTFLYNLCIFVASKMYIIGRELVVVGTPVSWMRVRLVIMRLLGGPPPGQQHSLVKIDHEIFSMVILFIPLSLTRKCLVR